LSQPALGSAWVLASALTHIHVGVGQAPGVVDLPVLRDSMGYFYIPGSSLKGSIKSTLLRLGVRNVDDYLGGEPGGKETKPGTLAFQDLYPLLVPIPSIDRGVIFATTPLLITKAVMLTSDTSVKSGSNSTNQSSNKEDLTVLLKELRIIEKKVINRFKNDKDLKMLLLTDESDGNDRLCISTSCQEVSKEEIEDIDDVAEQLKLINKAYSVLLKPQGRIEILVLRDTIAPKIFDRSLIRQARIRLKQETKTVERGGLWTEEYIPHFTLFSGAIIDTKMKLKSQNNSSNKQQNKQDNHEEPIEWITKIIEEKLGNTVIIGGKETIGKGILKLKTIK
jgi:CRISPR-associated protein Cmr4